MHNREEGSVRLRRLIQIALFNREQVHSPLGYGIFWILLFKNAATAFFCQNVFVETVIST